MEVRDGFLEEIMSNLEGGDWMKRLGKSVRIFRKSRAKLGMESWSAVRAAAPHPQGGGEVETSPGAHPVVQGRHDKGPHTGRHKPGGIL